MSYIITLISSDNKKYNVDECDLIRYSNFFTKALRSNFIRETTYNLDFSSLIISIFIQFIDKNEELNIKKLNKGEIDELFSFGYYLEAYKFNFMVNWYTTAKQLFNDLQKLKIFNYDNTQNEILDSLRNQIEDDYHNFDNQYEVFMPKINDEIYHKLYINYLYEIYKNNYSNLNDDLKGDIDNELTIFINEFILTEIEETINIDHVMNYIEENNISISNLLENYNTIHINNIIEKLKYLSHNF